jgi:hypothetical protein
VECVPFLPPRVGHRDRREMEEGGSGSCGWTKRGQRSAVHWSGLWREMRRGAPAACGWTKSVFFSISPTSNLGSNDHGLLYNTDRISKAPVRAVAYPVSNSLDASVISFYLTELVLLSVMNIYFLKYSHNQSVIVILFIYFFMKLSLPSFIPSDAYSHPHVGLVKCPRPSVFS